jgi:methionyl-tRNA synthetase
MIGKDILRFHAVYWPAFIMAAYPDQPEMLPTTVFAHGWIYYEQDKMSKSKGNVVYPEPIVDALDHFGAPGNDALRYYLLREATFGQDMSFSYEGLIQRYNSDLANDLGNLASRTVAMIHQFCGGMIPSDMRAVDLRAAGKLIHGYRGAFDRFDFSTVLAIIRDLISGANKTIVQIQPWELAKSNSPDDRALLEQTLWGATEVLRVSCVLLYPVMPHSAMRLWKQLGRTTTLEDERIEDDLVFRGFQEGTMVGKPEPIFPRLDKAATLAKLDELAEADLERDKPKEAFISVQTEKKPEAAPEHRIPSPQSPPPSTQPPAPSPALISIEDFVKVDMRVGEVKAAEHVPGAAKLLKLIVDIGTEVRQLVAGLAEYYQPENLIGMKVVVVTNLPPRKLRGVESNGMIVAATVGEQGRPVLVTFKEDVANGARLK